MTSPSPYLTPEEFAREFPGEKYWPRGGKREKSAGSATELSSTSSPAVTAAEIIRCGKIRRGELEYAGRVSEQEEGYHATAAEIIAAGKKARGEL